MIKIDEMPSQITPFSGVAVMLDADEEVVGVVENFVCLGAGSEIEGPQAGMHRSLLHQLGIEVDDPSALTMPNEKIGVSGPL